MPLARVLGPLFDALVDHEDGRRGHSCLRAVVPRQSLRGSTLAGGQGSP